MGIDRQRVRVGRGVGYQATDAEVSGIDAVGAVWPATITAVNPATGLVNLFVMKANGVALAKTSVSQGSQKGTYSTRGLAALPAA